MDVVVRMNAMGDGDKRESIPIREAAHRLVNELPGNATREDLMDDIDVGKAIERGLKDSRDGRIMTVAEVRAQFGLRS